MQKQGLQKLYFTSHNYKLIAYGINTSQLKNNHLSFIHYGDFFQSGICSFRYNVTWNCTEKDFVRTKLTQRQAEPRDGKRQTLVTSFEASRFNHACDSTLVLQASKFPVWLYTY